MGNSHSIDAFWLLYEAYMDQHPDTDLCVGILHYNGACIDEHVNFIDSNESVMRYYKKTGSTWKIKYNVTSASALTDRPWDTILMQPAKEDLADPTLNADGRHALAEGIARYVQNPHKIMWHISWPSPNDETFFSDDYVRVPPVGYKDKLMNLYGFNPVNQFNNMLTLTTANVLNDPLYDDAYCSGAAVMHALLSQGFTQLELWRDYTHLSDLGRLTVAYSMYAQLTGNPIQQVGIDTIPVEFRAFQYQYLGDMAVTEQMKDIVRQAANHSLEDPWNVPTK